MVFAQNGTLNLSNSRFDWPAQHEWLHRYFVFERATYALQQFVIARNVNKFNKLIEKYLTVQRTVFMVITICLLKAHTICVIRDRCRPI
jgi:hypothetical protein